MKPQLRREDGVRSPKGRIGPGETYEHYKGNRYEIIGIARDSNTLEEVVVYRGLYNSEEFGDNPLWTRPLAEFIGEVELNKKTIARFKIISS